MHLCIGKRPAITGELAGLHLLFLYSTSSFSQKSSKGMQSKTGAGMLRNFLPWPFAALNLVYRLLLTQRFLTFRCVPCVKIKNTDVVLPVKGGPHATPVMVIIPLNFARCTLPTHRNRQVKCSLMACYCLTKISIRAKRSISRVVFLFIVPSPFLYIARTKAVLTGLKAY